MRRTTISLPDETALFLQREARRRNSSISAVAREAIERQLGIRRRGKRKIPFAAIGSSGHTDTAARAEEILADEWPERIDVRDR